MSRLRCGPRKLGIAQNPHERSHPSAILTYAHGTADFGRGRLSRSNSGSGVRRHRDQLAACRAGHLGAVALGRGDVERLTEAGDLVDLGQLGGEFVAVPLGHAAGDDQARSVGALFVEREDRVDRLTAGVVDEGAGVDHDEVGERGVVGGLHAVREQRADQLVGVDVVLRAAERLDVEPLGHDDPRYLAGSAHTGPDRGAPVTPGSTRNLSIRWRPAVIGS